MGKLQFTDGLPIQNPMVNDGEYLFHLLSPILREQKTPQKLGPVP